MSMINIKLTIDMFIMKTNRDPLNNIQCHVNDERITLRL